MERMKSVSLPSCHDITRSAKDLGETCNDEIDIAQYIHVDKSTNCFVTDDNKLILICQLADATQVRCRTQRI
jgi:hypothetical protein